MIVEPLVEYKVHGYRNKWSVISTLGDYALLENNSYGDETCYLVVEIKDNVCIIDGRLVVMHVVCETFDGLEVALEDMDLI
jgi:hypothetical protein